MRRHVRSSSVSKKSVSYRYRIRLTAKNWCIGIGRKWRTWSNTSMHTYINTVEKSRTARSGGWSPIQGLMRSTTVTLCCVLSSSMRCWPVHVLQPTVRFNVWRVQWSRWLRRWIRRGLLACTMLRCVSICRIFTTVHMSYYYYCCCCYLQPLHKKTWVNLAGTPS